ncbi:MAG: arylsulfotransferase family protein [Flavobacteriaceae bacterium]
MKKKYYIYFLLLYIFCLSANAQTTIGLLHNTTEAYDGYTLFTPESNNDVYLVNNCGEMVNKWTFNEKPGLTCYLLENGNLLRAGRNNLEIRDWNNIVVWTFDMQLAGYNQHHDIEPLPNGNILCLLNKEYTAAEIIDEGKDPNYTSDNFRIDELIELQPIGTNNATLVWKWSFLDHIIQDFDATKNNYGNVGNHPELIDINYNNLYSDIIHLNSIDYNANLDQILISARHMSEIYIIDHSTTIAEAAGHTGGTYGKGGDLLYRWGNPLAYKQGNSNSQKLFNQHDARWVTDGYADQGKITTFNNGGLDGSFTNSSIHIITPEISSGEYQMTNATYLPEDFEWSWQGDILGDTVLEGRKSGAQSLPNGNMMICETSSGRISEIKKDGTLVWSYKNPTGQNTTIHTQYTTNPSSTNIFRGDKYPADYIGFNGKDLTPTSIIENENSVSENCMTLLGISHNELNDIKIINPSTNNIIQFNSTISLDSLIIYDTNGRKVDEHISFNNNYIEVSLAASIYILKLKKGNLTKFIKLVKK